MSVLCSLGKLRMALINLFLVILRQKQEIQSRSLIKAALTGTYEHDTLLKCCPYKQQFLTLTISQRSGATVKSMISLDEM